MSEASSTISAIPYLPGLTEYVPNVTSAILETYLEMRFRARQDTVSHLVGLPVEVPMDTVAHELAISRRTLGLNLYALAKVYPVEAKRWAAARAGREFLQPRHRAKGTVKLYSIVTDYNLERAHTIVLRRNIPFLRAAFANCGISATSLNDIAQGFSPGKTQRTETSSELTELATAPLLISSPATLVDLLLEASQLSRDRRSLRYPRLRKAVADGLAPASVLSAKQPKRKKSVNEAVEPELPEEVKARLFNLQKG